MQYNDIKELISIFEKSDLSELELNMDNAKIYLNRGVVRQQGQMSTVPVPSLPQVSSNITNNTAIEQNATSISAPEATGLSQGSQNAEGTLITAPLVGTFYAGPATDKPPFVTVGDKVEKGDVVCIVEAMKFMNEINSDVTGTVAELFVKDGDFVEFGQSLMRIQ